MRKRRKLIGEKILAERVKEQRKNSRAYLTIKNELQKEWREKILKRDGYKCRACQSDYHPQLCHITGTTTLLMGGHSIKESFREDNLVTLCFVCHKVQHNEQKGLLITETAKNRAKNIRKLFNSIKKERGWTAAWQLKYLNNKKH